MSFILKSKLLRNEIKHWILISVLTLWGITATLYGYAKSSKLVLIAIDDTGTRLVTTNQDKLLQAELRNFIKAFLEYYFIYDEKTFREQMGRATENMSESLWTSNQEKLQALRVKLEKSPLSQSMEVESIDLVDINRIEAVLNVRVRARMTEQKVRLKVNLEFRKHERTESNPWGFEITEVSDVVI